MKMMKIMKFRLNRYATMGFIAGYFIAGPLIRTIPYTETSLINLLQRGIIGLIIAIFVGLFQGTLDNLTEAKIEHKKLMKDLSFYQNEYNMIKKVNEIKNNGKLNTKQHK
jgi:hypothetical protein